MLTISKNKTLLGAALLNGLLVSGFTQELLASQTRELNISRAFLVGKDLPAKKLVLTFDDGPTDHTAEISTYLHSLGIPATFFLIGKKVVGHTDALQQLVADNHLVANHTYTHPRLTQVTNVVEEIMKTDEVLLPYITKGEFLFRAPYSDWSPDIAPILDDSPAVKYVGPILFDIDGADWSCWSDEHMTIEQCGQRYLDLTRSVGKGIVIMHDTGDGETIKLLKWLLPQLINEGFTFTNLDQVPNVNLNLRMAGAQIPPVSVTE